MIRTASAALLPLRDALTLLCGEVEPVTSCRLALSAARGRISAEAIVAPRAVPDRFTALRDGFAVDAASIGGASPYAPVPLAPSPPWVEAGESLPTGTDAVLPPEGFEGGAVVADVAVREGVRAPGEEIDAGEILITAGTRIGSLQLLGLAAIGLETVEVRLPRLRVISTGAPVLDPLASLLVRLIEDHGGRAESVATGHEAEAIAEAIRVDVSDAVIVLGGSGFGRTDHSAEALGHGGKVRAHGIALRPGETAAIGSARSRPALLLPGRPEAALAAFLALGRPLLARLTGACEVPPRFAKLLRKIVSPIGLTEVVFVRSRPDGVEPLGGSELPLRRLIEADGVVMVAPEREGYPAGEEIEVWRL
jgi:molybdopterin biosynthesis enzyme